MDKFSKHTSAPTPRRTAQDRRHSVSRELVLRSIEHNGAATVSELALATGLHENTVRGHLTRLETDGYVARETERRTGDRGRPTARWSAVSPERLGAYAGLAAALADALAHASDGAPALAHNAGVRWGEDLATGRGNHGGDAQTEILSIMREQGFAPEEIEEGSIALTRCPLLAVATDRPDIVCAVHAGMISGIAHSSSSKSGTAAPTLHTKLLPFVTPGTCRIHLKLAS